jgi:hypothetical protein
MKIAGKFAVLILLATLVLLPLQAVQAKGLADGPIFGENYTLKSGETLNEDLVVFGGSVSIEKDAKVNGAIVLFGGSFTLDGEVSKDVVVMGGAVKLGSDSHIRGNLVTFGAPVDRDAGAKVDGDVINNPTRPSLPNMPGTPSAPDIPNFVNNYTNPFWDALGVFFQSIVLALLAMLIALFLPVQLRRVSDGVVAQPLVSFGMGLLTLIMFIVVIVALALFSVFIITLFITVPLIFIVSVLFTAGMVLGWLALGTEVGVRIGQMFKGEWPLPLAAGLGVFLLNLVAQGVNFIPCIGGLISGVVAFAGLGAVLLTRFGTRPAALAAAPVTVESTPPAQS